MIKKGDIEVCGVHIIKTVSISAIYVKTLLRKLSMTIIAPIGTVRIIRIVIFIKDIHKRKSEMQKHLVFY